MFYLGGEFCLKIRDHTEYPRWIVDCDDPNAIDYYCVLSNGSVGGAPCPEGEDCANTPAESSTWSSLKALYR